MVSSSRGKIRPDPTRIWGEHCSSHAPNPAPAARTTTSRAPTSLYHSDFSCISRVRPTAPSPFPCKRAHPRRPQAPASSGASPTCARHGRSLRPPRPASRSRHHRSAPTGRSFLRGALSVRLVLPRPGGRPAGGGASPKWRLSGWRAPCCWLFEVVARGRGDDFPAAGALEDDSRALLRLGAGGGESGGEGCGGVHGAGCARVTPGRC